jgi:YebC/PmpR family DNA-binding regulatory protein
MGAQWKAKHKDVAANAKGRLFGKLAKDIMIAARHGADPAANARLRLVVEQARKVSMPKETLERAIKKGAGLTGEAVHFEHVIYEGYAPHRVPVMVECLTDNVNRAASDMRVLFRKGQQGTSGSVSWDFDHVGIIEAEAASKDADAEVAAIEAGAQDFEPADEDGVVVFLTDYADLDLVSRQQPAPLVQQARQQRAEEAAQRIGGVVEAHVLGRLLRAGIGQHQVGMHRRVDRKGDAEQAQPAHHHPFQVRHLGHGHQHGQPTAPAPAGPTTGARRAPRGSGRRRCAHDVGAPAPAPGRSRWSTAPGSRPPW